MKLPSNWVRWVLSLGLVGAVIGSASTWGELAARISWKSGGGVGERADWGEPAFYFALYALAGALVGGLAGAIAHAVTRRARSRA